MKFPEDVRALLARRFRKCHREWLEADAVRTRADDPDWPLEVDIGIPTEKTVLIQPEGVREWVNAWRNWKGAGTLVWSDRRWRTLGVQRVPCRLVIDGPVDVALWVGESSRWERARTRSAELRKIWPVLSGHLPRYFDVLAEYGDIDYERLKSMLSWIIVNPHSDLYPRQLPVSGLDSKWLENRKGLVSYLVSAIRGDNPTDRDFFRRCGLKALPQLLRLRILDPSLRGRIGGLGDITAPWEQVAALDLPAASAFIVENVHTGLAFDDLPGAVVIMGLGYGVDVLGRIPWLGRAQCAYWGDLDTHGFAILNRARSYLPEMKSILMDEATLFGHRDLWAEEKDPNSSDALPLLTDPEQALYRSIKRNLWGQNIRLEQERIAWDVAWKALTAYRQDVRAPAREISKME